MLTGEVFDNAKTVYASGCTGLAKLDAPNAKTVDASGCTGLAKLDAPKRRPAF